MRYSLHPEAINEFDNAVDYYRDIQQALGDKFENDFDSTVKKILLFPKAWTPIKANYRRCLLKKFPFGIIYQVEESENICLIFAVMHLHRKPYYWEDRKFS